MSIHRKIMMLLGVISCSVVALLLPVREASARCQCQEIIHSTGLDWASDSTCVGAIKSLESKLKKATAATCGDTGGVCQFQMAPGPCFWNGSAFQVDGSATYRCNVCDVFITERALNGVLGEQDRICGTLRRANIDLTQPGTHNNAFILPSHCDPPPPRATCSEASCTCLCLGFDDCLDLVLSGSCRADQELVCNTDAPVIGCACGKVGCVLAPTSSRVPG